MLIGIVKENGILKSTRARASPRPDSSARRLSKPTGFTSILDTVMLIAAMIPIA